MTTTESNNRCTVTALKLAVKGIPHLYRGGTLAYVMMLSCGEPLQDGYFSSLHLFGPAEWEISLI